MIAAGASIAAGTSEGLTSMLSVGVCCRFRISHIRRRLFSSSPTFDVEIDFVVVFVFEVVVVVEVIVEVAVVFEVVVVVG